MCSTARFLSKRAPWDRTQDLHVVVVVVATDAFGVTLDATDDSSVAACCEHRQNSVVVS